MRKIDKIILHCTATREGQDWTVEQIRKMHVQQNGWADIGYHYIIYRDGTIHEGRPVEKAGAHTAGYNATSIGVCYIGGCDSNMRPKDTRTQAQKTALIELVYELQKKYPNATIHGHREFAAKACPSFDVKKWLDDEYRPGILAMQAKKKAGIHKCKLVVIAFALFVLGGCSANKSITEDYTKEEKIIADTTYIYIDRAIRDTVRLTDTLMVEVIDSSYIDEEGTKHHDRTKVTYKSTSQIEKKLEECETALKDLHSSYEKMYQQKSKEKIVEKVKKVKVWWPSIILGLMFLGLVIKKIKKK